MLCRDNSFGQENVPVFVQYRTAEGDVIHPMISFFRPAFDQHLTHILESMGEKSVLFIQERENDDTAGREKRFRY